MPGAVAASGSRLVAKTVLFETKTVPSKINRLRVAKISLKMNHVTEYPS